jgi:Flp pilus assembly protein TadG
VPDWNLPNRNLPDWNLPDWLDRSGRPRDSGSAAVEFATIGVLLLIPLVYLVVTLGRIQAGSLASASAARSAARALSAAPSDLVGRDRARAASALAVTDQGFAADDATLTLNCSASPCLTPGARVQAQVIVRVRLPGIPAFVQGAIPLEVRLRSEQVLVVDEFRAAAPR